VFTLPGPYCFIQSTKLTRLPIFFEVLVQ
jgi:hypothetical protein